ncbi:MAG: signal peptide peptidase SppA [Desulfobacterales bacterium]
MRKHLMTVFAVLLFCTGCAMPRITLFPGGGDALEEYVLEGKGKDKVLMIPIQGKISDTPEKGLLRTNPGMVQQIVSHLRKAEKDPNIRAVLLKVDSPGGTVTASDLLWHEISEFKKRSRVKIVAAMMNLAASGGYYVCLPADRIVAHPTTITGSVGVIVMRPQLSGLMDKVGVQVAVSKTGKDKDMGSPFRRTTAEEEKRFQQLAERLGERFLTLVQKHRNPGPEAMKEIATARVFAAEEAKSLGLVDEIAYLSDALRMSKSLAGISPDAKVIVYRSVQYPDDNIYNTASVCSDVPVLGDFGLSLLPSAGFYYLWPPAVCGE